MVCTCARVAAAELLLLAAFVSEVAALVADVAALL
jgi:hypothetical protein